MRSFLLFDSFEMTHKNVSLRGEIYTVNVFNITKNRSIPKFVQFCSIGWQSLNSGRAGH